jgi:hypothetical protein
LILSGTVWTVNYQDESGRFPDRKDSHIRHLARLLAEPDRHFHALEFHRLHALPGEDRRRGRASRKPYAPPLAHLGRDESIDAKALGEYEKELRRLQQEIDKAQSRHDDAAADRLQKEFYALAEHVKKETAPGKLGHKRKCGPLSPAGKADQALRMGLSRLVERFREKKLPKLADHLKESLRNSECDWWYAPPRDTLPWHVTSPGPSHEK